MPEVKIAVVGEGECLAEALDERQIFFGDELPCNQRDIAPIEEDCITLRRCRPPLFRNALPSGMAENSTQFQASGPALHPLRDDLAYFLFVSLTFKVMMVVVITASISFESRIFYDGPFNNSRFQSTSIFRCGPLFLLGSRNHNVLWSTV